MAEFSIYVDGPSQEELARAVDPILGRYRVAWDYDEAWEINEMAFAVDVDGDLGSDEPAQVLELVRAALPGARLVGSWEADELVARGVISAPSLS